MASERDPDQHDIDVIVQEMHDGGVNWKKVQRLIDLCRTAVSELLAIREAGDEEIGKLEKQREEIVSRWLSGDNLDKEGFKNLYFDAGKVADDAISLAAASRYQLRQAEEERDAANENFENWRERIRIIPGAKEVFGLCTAIQNSPYLSEKANRENVNSLVEIVKLQLADKESLCQKLREAREEIESYESQELETTQVIINHRNFIADQKKTIDSLAALKSAPGMGEVDAMERELLDEIPSWSQRTTIELLANLARRSIAAREEVVGMLKHILSCIITVKQENTPEWMEYIAEEVNRINEATGDPDRVSLRFGGIVIVKGDSEIVEGE